MVKTCARLTECRVNGTDMNYIASSCDGDKKFIHYVPLDEPHHYLPCLLNHLVEVDHDPRYHDRGCIRECTNQCANECMEYDENCIKDCDWQCDKGCVEGSESTSDDLYSIANRMKFATDGKCSEYLDCL